MVGPSLDLGQAANLGDLLEAARSAEERFGGRQLWFRGHASRDWKLVPTAHRRHPILEFQMASHFRMRAPAFRQHCPSHLDYAAWLPLMRHYGLPTRLLDWSESVIVAAFFATKYKPMPGSSIIWFLSPGHLNTISIGDDIVPFLIDRRILPIVKAGFLRDMTIDFTAAAIAPRHDPRMVAQLGNFTVHGSRDPLEARADAHKFLARVEVPECAKDRVNYDLLSVGIRLSNLFPDLDHLAMELSELKALGPNGEDLDA